MKLEIPSQIMAACPENSNFNKDLTGQSGPYCKFDDGTLLGPSFVQFDGLRRSNLRAPWDQATRLGAFSTWEMPFCKEVNWVQNICMEEKRFSKGANDVITSASWVVVGVSEK